MADFLFVADTENSRIVKRLAADLSYVSEVGSEGVGNDEFNFPSDVATDGTHIYVADTDNNRIVKRLLSDLSYVGEVASWDGGNDEFLSPVGITCSGTHIYVSDAGNGRVVKLLASDLSYVAEVVPEDYAGDGTLVLGSCADGTYLYVCESEQRIIFKYALLDLSYVDEITFFNGWEFVDPYGLCTDGAYLYVSDYANHRVVKFDLSDLSYVSEVGNKFTAAATGAAIVSGNCWVSNVTGTFTNGHTITFANSASTATVTGYSDAGPLEKQLFFDWVSGTPNYLDSSLTTSGGAAADIDGSIDIRLAISYDSLVGGPFTDTDIVIINTGNTPEASVWTPVISDTGSTLTVWFYGQLASEAAFGVLPEIGSAITLYVPGAGEDEFNYPSDIACNDTYVYVLEESGCRIVKRLSNDLSYDSEIGSEGVGNDEFMYPLGLAFASTGVEALIASPFPGSRPTFIM